MKKRAMIGRTALVSMLVGLSAQAEVFDFVDGSEAENITGGPGLSWTITEDNGPLTITTVDVIGDDGSSALDGSNNTVNVVSYDALAIRTWHANDDRVGIGNTEAWIFSFDRDVTLTEFEFESQDTGMEVTISTNDVPVIVSTNAPMPSRWGIDLDVPAGTPITIASTGLGNFRIESLTAVSTDDPPLEYPVYGSVGSVIYAFDSETTDLIDAAIGAREYGQDLSSLVEVYLTSVDVIGADGSRASEGAGHMTGMNTAWDAVGVDDANNDTAGENQLFDPGEGWVFCFSRDVYLDLIDVSSFTEDCEFMVSCSAFSNQNYTVADLGTGGAVTYSNVFLARGTEITISNTSDSSSTNDVQWRLDRIDVTPTNVEHVTFNFVDDAEGDYFFGSLDGGGVGSSDSVFDYKTRESTSNRVTVTTQDVIGEDGTLASAGAGHTLAVENELLGVNDGLISTNEGWAFRFDCDVQLFEIDLEGQEAGDEVTISSPAFSDIVLTNGVLGDIHDLGSTLVSSGTVVTVQMTSGTNAVSIRSLAVISYAGAPTYANWVIEQGLTSGVNAAYGDDPDGDNMDNLTEYALGADALSKDASEFLPGSAAVTDGSSGYLYYVYRRRVDYADRGLSYDVGSGVSLTAGSLTNVTEWVGAGAIDGDTDFESVTNRVSTDIEERQFIQLEVTID